MSHFSIHLAAILWTAIAAAAPAPGPPLTDRAAFEELQRIAARRPEYSEELGRRLSDLITRLWTDPTYRHPVATVINGDGGRLDRIWNRWTLQSWGGGEDLPEMHAVDEKLIRGGQPTAAGFATLKQMGVGTVVNLRAEEPGELATVRRLGLRYVYLPIPDTDRPTDEQIRAFLALIDRPDTGKVYVHCAWGVNRTGTMVALWRIQRGMSARRALAEAVALGLDERRLNADRPASLIRGFRPIRLGRR